MCLKGLVLIKKSKSRRGRWNKKWLIEKCTRENDEKEPHWSWKRFRRDLDKKPWSLIKESPISKSSQPKSEILILIWSFWKYTHLHHKNTRYDQKRAPWSQKVSLILIKSGVEVFKGVFRFFLILILKSKSSLLNASPSYLYQRLKIFTFLLTFQKINQTLTPLNIPSQSTSEITDYWFLPPKSPHTPSSQPTQSPSNPINEAPHPSLLKIFALLHTSPKPPPFKTYHRKSAFVSQFMHHSTHSPPPSLLISRSFVV